MIRKHQLRGLMMLIFPNYYKYKKLLHYRNNTLMQNEPISIKTESTPIIKDTLFWCGLYHNHFGHTMAEFSSKNFTI